MTSWRIREATSADLPELLALHHELYIAYRDEILDSKVIRLIAYHNFETILAEDIRYLIAQRDSMVLVAEQDGQLLGYITGRIMLEERRILAKRGVIEDWYVRPALRNAGVGRALLQKIQAYFTEQECTMVEATTWMSNKRARELYASDKWTEIQVLLRKELSS